MRDFNYRAGQLAESDTRILTEGWPKRCSNQRPATFDRGRFGGNKSRKPKLQTHKTETALCQPVPSALRMNYSLGGNAAVVAPGNLLGYVDAVLLPELALNGFHLIFEAQLQLLKPGFFQLFVFAEITFLGKRIEPFCVLRMLLSQSAELLVIGHELVSLSQHPADLQTGIMRSR